MWVDYFFVIITWLILITASCTTSPGTQATFTPTAIPASPLLPATPTPPPTPTPFGGNLARLGPLPISCSPGGPAPQNISPDFGPAVGANPVWMGAGAFRKLGPLVLQWSPSDAVDNHDQYGWSHKFLIVVATSYQGIVTLHGTNMSDGSPVSFGAQDAVTTGKATTLVLDTRSPTIANRNDQWTQFPGGLDIPKAGCYRLEAQWQRGSWSITFAAGTVN